MKKILITVVLSIPAFGLSVVQQPVAVNTQHWGTRILASFDAVNTAYVVWGTSTQASCTNTTTPPCSAQYPNSDLVLTVQQYAVVNWFIAGLTENTDYYARVCGSTTGAANWTCSNEVHFKTSVLPAVFPAPATLPQTTPDPTLPTQPGTTRQVGVSTGCHAGDTVNGITWETDWLACWETTQCGDTMQWDAAHPMVGINSIPTPGFPGPIQMNPKNCDDAHRVRIENVGGVSVLPPAGVRINPSYRSSLAPVVPNWFGHYASGQTPTQANCNPGAYFWDAHDTGVDNPGFRMKQCRANAAINITNVTGPASNWTVTTVTNHGYSVNDIVYITGVLGISLVNGTCYVKTVPTLNTFTTACTASYSHGELPNTYTSGGTVQNHSWVDVVPYTPLTTPAFVMGGPPAYNMPAGNCNAFGQGAWGYDGTYATHERLNGLPEPGITSIGSVARCVLDETGTLVWRRWGVRVSSQTDATFVVNTYYAIDLSGSSYIDISGMDFAGMKVPPEPLFLRTNDPQVKSLQSGKIVPGFIRTDASSHHINISHSLIDCSAYPYGMQLNAMQLNGDAVTFTDNYLTGCNNWFGAQDRGQYYDNFYGTAVIRSLGTGFLARNNYFEVYGIGMHLDDGYSDLAADCDATIQRNTFYRNPTHFYGSAENLAAYPPSNVTTGEGGVYWVLRQFWETKNACRVLIDGNTFTNNWRNVSQAAAIALTPRMESSFWGGPSSYGTYTANSPSAGQTTVVWPSFITTGLATGNWMMCPSGGVDQVWQVLSTPDIHSTVLNGVLSGGTGFCFRADWPYGISDVTISNNTFTHLPDGISVFGMLYGLNTLVMPLGKITMRNNVYNDILDDGSRTDPEFWNTSGGGFGWFDTNPYANDIISDHETIYQLGGQSGTVFGATYVGGNTNKSLKGVQLTNNLVSMKDYTTCTGMNGCANNSPWTSHGASGDAMFSTITNSKVASGNLFQMVGGLPGGQTYTGVSWLSSISAIKFQNTAQNNFRLRFDSPGASSAASVKSNDGTDTGANIDALESAQGVVTSAHQSGVTSTSAVITWFQAQDTCASVDWSTNSAFSTYTRVSGAGHAGIQSITLSGLTANTVTYVRVNCPVQQPTWSFRTLP